MKTKSEEGSLPERATRPDSRRPLMEMDAAEHVRIFNEAASSGRWEPFIDRFAEDAELEFVGVPAGPFIGRQAIARAYRENPPDE